MKILLINAWKSSLHPHIDSVPKIMYIVVFLWYSYEIEARAEGECCKSFCQKNLPILSSCDILYHDLPNMSDQGAISRSEWGENKKVQSTLFMTCNPGCYFSYITIITLTVEQMVKNLSSRRAMNHKHNRPLKATLSTWISLHPRVHNKRQYTYSEINKVDFLLLKASPDWLAATLSNGHRSDSTITLYSKTHTHTHTWYSVCVFFCIPRFKLPPHSSAV